MMSEYDQSLNYERERPRLVAKKILAKSRSEGKGAIIMRSIGRPQLKYLDQFLLLDEFEVAPPAGFPNHPHRGFLNAFVYTFEGEGVFRIPNSSPVEAHHLLVLGPGTSLSVWNKSSTPLRFTLVGGHPLDEPVVMQDPFVMNTQPEIEKTIEDYSYSKNEFEMARSWRSKWVE